MDSLYTGQIAALIAALCWSICSICFTAAGHHIGSLAVGMIRLMMALVLFSLYGLIVRDLPFPTDASMHAWFFLSLSGLVGFLFGDIFLFRSFVMIGPRLALLVMALWPAMAAILGWWVLDEVLSVQAIFGMALTMTGVIWVIRERQPKEDGTHHHISSKGILFAFLGAIGQAGGLILSKVGMAMHDSVTGLKIAAEYDAFASNQIRAIAAVAGYIILHTLLHRWGRIRMAVVQVRPMAMLTAGAIAGPFIGVALSLIAIQHITNGVAATIMATAPVLIIPFMVIIYHEKISQRAIIGAIVAVIGVAILFLA